jgi:uncharacterized protein (DUF433 family)
LWDYDLSEADVRAIMRAGDSPEKEWLAARILESAAYGDVWKYMSLAELQVLFPKLQLKPQVRAAWAFALQTWNSEDTSE